MNFQELEDQLNKVKAEKEKSLKSFKTLKVNHDVSTTVHTFTSSVFFL